MKKLLLHLAAIVAFVNSHPREYINYKIRTGNFLHKPATIASLQLYPINLIPNKILYHSLIEMN